MSRLEGVVVVTGAASGIGAATARLAAARGADVVGVDLQTPVPGEQAPGVTYVQADVTCDEDSRRVAHLVAQRGRVTGLFNCAGVEDHGNIVTMDRRTWDQVLAVNLTSIYVMSHTILPHISAGGGGVIVNMSSIQGVATQRDIAAYAAAKGGVMSLTRAMALDHGREGVRVVAVCPGTIATPLVVSNATHFNPDDPDAQLADWGTRTALGRIGETDEVAKFVVFLLSDEASFVTGSSHLIDGGLLASF